MGLSNEERYGKIIHSISHITDLTDKFQDHQTENLKKLVDKLWYEFLKNDSNGAFWLMGSDIANEWMEKETVAAVAFACHVPKMGTNLEDLVKERREKDHFFDSYKALSSFCDIDRLLGQEKGAVLMTYLHTQNIAYALCRYPDDFRDRYEDLNRLLRTIQGECFKIMKKDYQYAYAWMLSNLCDKIFESNEKDVVNQWWVKHYVPHHIIKMPYDKYDEIFEAYRKYQFRKLTVQERIDLTFLITDEHFGEFEHIYKEFLKMVNDYNKGRKKDRIDVKKIEEHYKKCKAALEKKKKEPYQRECEFTGNYVDHDGKIKNIYHYGDDD